MHNGAVDVAPLTYQRPFGSWLSGFNPKRCHAESPRAKRLFCFLEPVPKFDRHKKPLRRLSKQSTGLSVGGPSGVNCAPDEKRYRWERVCNTAQMVGEDSDHDPNGCRVLMFPTGSRLKAFSGCAGKG
jgi:hypothetical protein